MKIKEKSTCQYDLVSLGEVMLRMDPGDGRIRTTRHFNVWEGGGEYNVARAFKKCFNQRSAIVTSFVKNEVGKLVEDLILQGGVDTRFIKWKDFFNLLKYFFYTWAIHYKFTIFTFFTISRNIFFK